MAATTIVTKYISGTGRRNSPSGGSTSKYYSIGGDPGTPGVKHAVFNWKQELIVSFTDGTKDSYQLRFKPIYPSTLCVYINGLLQRQGVDYRLDEKNIIFNQIIPAGFNIVATYNALQVEL